MKSLPHILSLIFLILTISCSSQKSQEAYQNVKILLDRLIENPSLTNASLGIIISDAKTGEVTVSQNPGKSLIPASTQKLLIAGAALETFGAGHTFTTSLYYSGQIDANGTIQGDIVIHGGGDPVLGSERFAEHYGDIIASMATAIREAGIRKIDGKIIGDGSYFGRPTIPDTWIWEDIGNYYGGPAYGLNIFENTYKITFSSGDPFSLTQITRVEPALPGIAFKNLVTAASNNRDNAYIYGSYLSPTREIRGTIPAHRESFTIKGAVPDPPLLAATLLNQELTESGIPVAGTPESVWVKIDEKILMKLLDIHSPPMSQIVNQLNTKSINLYAETLLLHLAKAKTENISVETGCHALAEFWSARGMDTTGLFLEDASGLSRANAITPAQMAFLLLYMKNQSQVSEAFIESLPEAGESGSLINAFTSVKGKFRAKSGYMLRVLNYAGYIETASGKNLIVVLMVNNYICSGSEMRKLWEGFTDEIYKLY